MSRPPAPPSRPEAKYRTSPRWATNGQPSKTAELSSALVPGMDSAFTAGDHGPAHRHDCGRRRRGEAEATSCPDQPPDGAHRSLLQPAARHCACINWRSSIDRPAAAAHSPIGVFTRATRAHDPCAMRLGRAGLCMVPASATSTPSATGSRIPLLGRLRELVPSAAATYQRPTPGRGASFRSSPTTQRRRTRTTTCTGRSGRAPSRTIVSEPAT